MQKVIAINLNGNAYQLDEQAYEALRDYLDRANAQLGANPDKSEIVRDLEQSIAEKCARHLGPGKSVVTTSEVEQILREIGPIDSGINGGYVAVPPAPEIRTPATRLYQIREGGMVSGVCNGLAAYFNLDPTIIRIGFVLAAVAEMRINDAPPVMAVGTYALLVFLVPYAKTSQELAAAQGTSTGLPYKVQRGVERIRRTIFRGSAKVAGSSPSQEPRTEQAAR